jgi:hypothetical protein
MAAKMGKSSTLVLVSASLWEFGPEAATVGAATVE